MRTVGPTSTSTPMGRRRRWCSAGCSDLSLIERRAERGIERPYFFHPPHGLWIQNTKTDLYSVGDRVVTLNGDVVSRAT